jgi:hypothetical protein
MSGGSSNERKSKRQPQELAGTTLHVYRILYREGKPLGINDVQKKANLSSPSLAYYHLNKLVESGLASQKDGGYVVDRVIFENMMRVGRSLIPLQTTFTAFFATMIVGLLVFLRNYSSSSPVIFLFALVTNAVACGIFTYYTITAVRKYRT